MDKLFSHSEFGRRHPNQEQMNIFQFWSEFSHVMNKYDPHMEDFFNF